MASDEQKRLEDIYARMPDDKLERQYRYGPSGYTTDLAWKVVEAEAARRGLESPASSQIAPSQVVTPEASTFRTIRRDAGDKLSGCFNALLGVLAIAGGVASGIYLLEERNIASEEQALWFGGVMVAFGAIMVAYGVYVFIKATHVAWSQEALERHASTDHTPRRRCSRCGASSPVDSAHCTACGQALMRKCLRCSSPIEPSATFCGACGTKQ